MNTKMNRSAAAWIWDFAGEYRSRYMLSVLSAVCGVICGILPYFVMASIIADLLGGRRDMNGYLKNWLLMAALRVGRCGFHRVCIWHPNRSVFITGRQSFDTMHIEAGVQFLFASPLICKAFSILFNDNRLYGSSARASIEPAFVFTVTPFNESSVRECIFGKEVCIFF